MACSFMDILAEAWQERGITIAELSRRSGVQYHRIRRAFTENGRLRYDDAAAIAKVLKIELR